jgi:hypothetical protein
MPAQLIREHFYQRRTSISAALLSAPHFYQPSQHIVFYKFTKTVRLLTLKILSILHAFWIELSRDHLPSRISSIVYHSLCAIHNTSFRTYILATVSNRYRFPASDCNLSSTANRALFCRWSKTAKSAESQIQVEATSYRKVDLFSSRLILKPNRATLVELFKSNILAHFG